MVIHFRLFDLLKYLKNFLLFSHLIDQCLCCWVPSCLSTIEGAYLSCSVCEKKKFASVLNRLLSSNRTYVTFQHMGQKSGWKLRWSLDCSRLEQQEHGNKDLRNSGPSLCSLPSFVQGEVGEGCIRMKYRCKPVDPFNFSIFTWGAEVFPTSVKNLLEKGAMASPCRCDRSREGVHPQHNLKCLGSVTSPEVKGEIDFLLVLFSSTLFFLTPFSCYLNFQTSALMSCVGTSRGLLAHGQVLVLVNRRESHILLGRGVGPTHSSHDSAPGIRWESP